MPHVELLDDGSSIGVDVTVDNSTSVREHEQEDEDFGHSKVSGRTSRSDVGCRSRWCQAALRAGIVAVTACVWGCGHRRSVRYTEFYKIFLFLQKKHAER